MTPIATDHLGPFGFESATGIRRVFLKVRHLCPHQESEGVGPIQPAGILDLLMLARAVETHRLGELDVATQVVVGRRGHEATRKVTLVEHESLHVGPAVQQHPPAFRLYLPYAEVALDTVDLVAVVVT